MIIEFRLFDKSTPTFRKVYFKQWLQGTPIFTSNRLTAKQYFYERKAAQDLYLLNIIKSDIAITLSVKIVPYKE